MRNAARASAGSCDLPARCTYSGEIRSWLLSCLSHLDPRCRQVLHTEVRTKGTLSLPLNRLPP